jgi:hypothetical protein
MPGFDRTRPMGAGAMTGGSRGTCNTLNAENTRHLGVLGRGMMYGRGLRGGYGIGMGMRRGLGRGFAVNTSVYSEQPDSLNMLRQQVDSLQSAIDTINRRIADLDK